MSERGLQGDLANPDTRLNSRDESYVTDEGRKDTTVVAEEDTRGADECTYVDCLKDEDTSTRQ